MRLVWLSPSPLKILPPFSFLFLLDVLKFISSTSAAWTQAAIHRYNWSVAWHCLHQYSEYNCLSVTSSLYKGGRVSIYYNDISHYHCMSNVKGRWNCTIHLARGSDDQQVMQKGGFWNRLWMCPSLPVGYSPASPMPRWKLFIGILSPGHPGSSAIVVRRRWAKTELGNWLAYSKKLLSREETAREPVAKSRTAISTAFTIVTFCPPRWGNASPGNSRTLSLGHPSRGVTPQLCSCSVSCLNTTLTFRQTIPKWHFPTATRPSVSGFFNKSLKVTVRLATVMMRNPENGVEISHHSVFPLGNSDQLQVLK